MTSSEFKIDRYYSRLNYARGLVVTLKASGKYYYLERGIRHRPVKGGSSVHKLDDFYESDRLGYKLDTNIDEHIAKKKAMYDAHRAKIAQRESIALISTPSGKSEFFEAYERSLDKARKIKLTKVDKMGRFENDKSMVAEMASGAKTETIEIAQITIGKMIYVNSTELIARFVPKLKWYEKLLTSKKKREIIVMIGTYVAIKAVQTKYDHYLLQSVTSYINYQLQTELIGGMTQETLDKIFSRFEKVED